YLYHRQTDTMNEQAIKDLETKKFLLIQGDFFGIQDFIFKTSGDLRKLRSKILRGRSFAVSLFSELAADMICREIGLPFASVVLNAAGKFTIIAPNTDQASAAVENVEKTVNDWLWKFTYGQNSLGLVSCEACGADLAGYRFVKLRSELQARLERKKLNRMDLGTVGGVVSDYLDSFDSESDQPVCPLCGKRPRNPRTKGDNILTEVASSCAICRDQVFLGTNVVKKRRVAIFRPSVTISNKDNCLVEPLFGRYQLSFTDSETFSREAANGDLLRLWDIAPDFDSESPLQVATKFINGHVPVFTEEDKYRDQYLAGEKAESRTSEMVDQIEIGAPRTFHHIAAMALNPDAEVADPPRFNGVAALGALKADVDNLGALISFGLPEKEITLARLATLSRQMNFYFTVYLPHLLRTDSRFGDIYTVFAGGDDLFVIGPWNKTIDLARELSQSFRRYVCCNPKITFSAGLITRKASAPVDKLAEEAERALEQSKEAGRDRLTVFSQTVCWSNLDELDDIKNTLSEWYGNRWINNAMLYRLNGFIEMADRESCLGEDKVSISDMGCLKWRSNLAYTCERNVAKDLKGEDRKDVVINVNSQIAGWLQKMGGNLRIPLWEILYNMR
ncbi:MAG: type III-A CRISPR-associated protein Cas10/Csm1, partial [Desulfomonilaceae bacterium]